MIPTAQPGTPINQHQLLPVQLPGQSPPCYGCKGLVKDWDADRDRWVVEDGGKKILVKAGNTFVKDGHVARLAILEQAAYSEWADGLDGSDG